MQVIEGLKPESVWNYFYQISQIPRGSKNEKAIGEYVMNIATKLNLEAKMDEVGNVLVSKSSHKNCINSPSVVLQSHLDMVCEKNKNTEHDFLKDPIKMKRTGDWMGADGTTLGADNGIGVALQLAIMEDKDLIHGPLEFLFTIDEETGLTGAKFLKKGWVASNIMINLDSEEEGIFYIGCAGGNDTEIKLTLEYEAPPEGYQAFVLRVEGLRGGHSGCNIGEERANALKLLTRVLWEVTEKHEVRLTHIEGGDKHNAIPREAEAVIHVPSSKVNDLKSIVNNYQTIFLSEFKGIESEISLTLTSDNSSKVIKKDIAHRLLSMLYVMPHGIVSMSHDIAGLVETSTNLAAIKLNNSEMTILTSQRSSVSSRLEDITNQVQSAGDLSGFSVARHEGYAGWQPNIDSPILKTAIASYEKLFGQKPKVTAIHAGLECGVIGSKFPQMDMISMGPSMEGVHSPVERIYIPSVDKFYTYLCELLQNIK